MNTSVVETSVIVRQLADDLHVLSKRLASVATHIARLERKPATDPNRPSATAKKDRDDALIAAYRDGTKPSALAAQWGISRQRVSQILLAAGENPATVRERRLAERRAEREQAARAERIRTCRVCHNQFEAAHSRAATCSAPCAEAWQLGRRYFDTALYEKHRRYLGVAGPPNRRFVNPNSATVKAILAVGRSDVLPAQRTKPPRRPICAATTSSGKPCTRPVPNGDDGDLCHIHRAISEGRTINMRRAS